MARFQEEKRETPRVEVQLSIDLKTKYVYTTASVLNISRHGLFIKTLNPLPEGSQVEIVMHSPMHETPQHFKGIVRWGRKTPSGSIPAGMGVKFCSPDVDLLDTLAEEIKHSPKNI